MTNRTIYKTAHTGCMNTPMNSAASAKAALAWGADIVEDDIRLTRDGVLVLAHDDLFALPDGTEGSIAARTFAELGGGGGAQERLMPLEPVLSRVAHAGRLMNLDLKADETIEPVAALLRRLSLEDRAFLSGCEYDRAMRVCRTAPQLRKLLNADIGLFRRLEYKEAVDITISQARSAGCFGINAHHRLATPYLIEAARRDGLPVYVWTVDGEEDMKRYARMGAASITTRNIAGLVAALELQSGGASHEL